MQIGETESRRHFSRLSNSLIVKTCVCPRISSDLVSGNWTVRDLRLNSSDRSSPQGSMWICGSWYVFKAQLRGDTKPAWIRCPHWELPESYVQEYLVWLFAINDRGSLRECEEVRSGVWYHPAVFISLDVLINLYPPPDISRWYQTKRGARINGRRFMWPCAGVHGASWSQRQHEIPSDAGRLVWQAQRWWWISKVVRGATWRRGWIWTSFAQLVPFFSLGRRWPPPTTNSYTLSEIIFQSFAQVRVFVNKIRLVLCWGANC